MAPLLVFCMKDDDGREPLSSSEVFRGRLISVSVEEWSTGRREVVRHPGACAIVAITAEHDVILVRQFREAIRGHLLEVPAGIRDVDSEEAAACAARELLEETGHRAGPVEPLGSILTSPGFADERIDLFLAETSAEPVAPAAEDGVETVRLPLAEALAAVDDGRIQDAKTVAALLLASRALGARDGEDRAGILYRAPGAEGVDVAEEAARAEPDEGGDAP